MATGGRAVRCRAPVVLSGVAPVTTAPGMGALTGVPLPTTARRRREFARKQWQDFLDSGGVPKRLRDGSGARSF